MRRTNGLTALLALVGIIAGSPIATAGSLCAPLDHEGARYTVCTIDLRKDRLQLFWQGKGGAPLGSLRALKQEVEARGGRLRLSMNAGMFDWSLAPVGLYVEAGQQTKPLNRADGPGNFHLKPNGVFYLNGDTAGVMTSDSFSRSGLKPQFATQSGPMLVIGGNIHPRFSGYAKSRKIRNGVGMSDKHTVIFAISRDAVTFPQFAALFRERLKCRDSLYLDGTVSSLHVDDDASMEQGDFWPLGPLIGAVSR